MAGCYDLWEDAVPGKELGVGGTDPTGRGTKLILRAAPVELEQWTVMREQTGSKHLNCSEMEHGHFRPKGKSSRHRADLLYGRGLMFLHSDTRDHSCREHGALTHCEVIELR